MTDRQTDRQTGYPSVDKPWIKYYKEGISAEPLVRDTVFGLIYDRNKDYLSDKAIKYFDNDISFDRLFSYVEKCTKSLLYNGIKRGDCINILAAGIPEAIYLVLACSRIGAIANFINPLFDNCG